jgi:uncharacterized protein YecT (DUF1311 family)
MGARMKSPLGIVVVFCLAACTLSAYSQQDESDAVKHGAAANLEYRAVFSRSKTPCSEDYSTAPYLQCMSKELDEIEKHVDAFVEDLRGVTDSQKELDALNQTDKAWRAYRESMCQLPWARGLGTVRGPMSVGCRWSLDRAYMQQLHEIYVLSQFPNRNPDK